MTRRLWMFVVQCLIFPMTICQNKRGDGFCMPPQSTAIVCCIGFYNSGENCIECEPGTTGENCSLTCPPDYFGLQCTEQCNCSSDEYCDPTNGCLTISTEISYTGLGLKTSDTMTNIPKDSDSNHSDTGTGFLVKFVLPFALLAIVVLIVGTVCIRRWHVKTMKKTKDELSLSKDVADVDTETQQSAKKGLSSRETVSSQIYKRISHEENYRNANLSQKETMATGEGPPPCPGPSPDVSSHQRKENVHINWGSLGTVSERSNEVLQISCIDKGAIQEQTKDQQSYIYSISSKHSRKQLHCDNSDSACSNVTYDEELYANSHSIEHSNSCFRQEGDSDEYFDVSYDKQKKMSCIVLPNPDA